MWENAVRYSPIFYGIPQDASTVFYPTKMQLASIAQRYSYGTVDKRLFLTSKMTLLM